MSAEQLLESDETYSKRKRLMAIFAVIAVAVLILGLTLSWFVGSQTASTVGKISEPSKLKILGPNETAIEQLDLSYDASNIGSDNKVTVTRGFCVESGTDGFDLYVANTTNITGLSISVYNAVDSGSSPADVSGDGYSWKKSGEAIQFKVINDDDNDGIANTPTGNNDPTFDNYTGVQANAAPLYRYVPVSTTGGDSDTVVSNYIIELTWKETVKETDIVYLIARSLQ